MARILVTGAAGFIGFHLSRALLNAGHRVIGVDNLNAYYDVALKQARLDQLTPHPDFLFARLDIADSDGLKRLFEEHDFEVVAHLAGQAGVRRVFDDARVYVKDNVLGIVSLFECACASGVRHMLYASSSSVYGANARLPFSEADPVDHPISLYAATKRAGELIAHTYAHTYGLPCTGMRFFSVYGPWGRPDMAYYSFARAIEAGEPIRLFNHGRHSRDMTYIGDVVEAIMRLIDRAPCGGTPCMDSPACSPAPFRVLNIGNRAPVQLCDLVRVIECGLGRRARIVSESAQPGEVADTIADTRALESLTGYAPDTRLETGMSEFLRWFCEYHHVRVAT